MKKKQISGFIFQAIFLMTILGPMSVWAGIAGDVDSSGAVDLKDAVLSLKICAGITPDNYVYKKNEINGDGKIGLEEAIYDLQVVANLRSEETIWYKDADGDGYSDGTTLISASRPSLIYYDESEVFTSGDTDDNNPNVHPNATPEWVAFDEAEPADSSASLEVDVPVSTSQEVLIEYSIPGMSSSESPEDGNIYNILNIDGCGYTTDVGKPRLPVVRRYVAIPEGSSVTTQIMDPVFREIDNFYVYPAQEALPEIDGAPVPPFDADTDTYSTDAFYPSNIVELEGPVIIRGVSMMIVQIHPVQFNPVQKKVRAYSSLKVILTFSGGTRSLRRSTRLKSPAFDTMLSRLVLNNAFLGSERNTRAAYDSGNSLLIITHPNFLSAAEMLKQWKIRKGIETEVRTTNQTGSSAVAIQSYIKNAYQTWSTPPTYVLLIGDAEFIPTHYQTVHPYTKSPQGRTGTDLYYATVDGSDYFPDISIGRLSVDTLAQANKRINDIISYEKAVVTDNNFYTKAAICGYFQHARSGYADRRFAQTSEDIAAFLSGASYLNKYTVDRIYYTESNITPEYWSKNYFGGGPAGDAGDMIPAYLEKPGFAWNGSSSAITSAINNGRFLVTHRDHGWTGGWGDPYYTVNHVQSLTNGSKLPVVWSINCQTGWFDNETDDSITNTSSSSIHFSEAWERNSNGGAVGVIAASRVSYSGHNDRLIWGWMDAIWPNFEKNYQTSGTAFDQPVYEMGPVLNYGKYYYANNYSESLKRKTEFEMFHWFGDPTMQIWTDVPQALGVSHVSVLSPGATSLGVTVNQASALICISKDGEILAKTLSNGGATTLSWSQGLSAGDEVYITVSKHNFRPYEGTVNCSVSCSYSISPASQTFTYLGGINSVSVTTPSECSWTASSNTSWITVTYGNSGIGNGIVRYSVANNTGTASRTGTITIAGKIFNITQYYNSISISISGYFKDANNNGIGGVYVGFFSGGSGIIFSTNSSGYYSNLVPYGWSGQVMPEKMNYTFTPINRSYTNLTSDMTNQNFIGTAIYTGRIPDTGQTKCYDEAGTEINCAGTGQDGEYLINPPSYTKLDANGNDLADSASSWAMVRDNVTGLIWEVKQNKDGVQDYSNPHDADNTYTWYDSNSATNGGDAGTPGDGTDTEDFINALNAQNYGGHNDWRMPEINEMVSIVDLGQYNLSIDTVYFPNNTSSISPIYWSATHAANSSNGAWSVEFYGGSIGNYGKSGGRYVRAVCSRKSQIFGKLNINNDGTVTDSLTGLMWQQSALDSPLIWQNSILWCENLQLAGYKDWRLPNRAELRSIVNYDRYYPSIYTEYLLNTILYSYNYWTSTTQIHRDGYAWSVYFDIGDDIFPYYKLDNGYTRSVRGGQPLISGHLYITSPLQASHWDIGNSMPIKWDTQSISGNVKISLSRDGGKTFNEIIASSTSNDGSYTWTITGAASVNCALKVEPLSDSSKGTVQSLFEIK